MGTLPASRLHPLFHSRMPHFSRHPSAEWWTQYEVNDHEVSRSDVADRCCVQQQSERTPFCGTSLYLNNFNMVGKPIRRSVWGDRLTDLLFSTVSPVRPLALPYCKWKSAHFWALRAFRTSSEHSLLLPAAAITRRLICLLLLERECLVVTIVMCMCSERITRSI